MKVANLSDDICKALIPVVTTCEAKITELKDILTKILPDSKDHKWKKGWKAITSLGEDKHIQEILESLDHSMKAIHHYQGASMALQTSVATALLEKVSSAFSAATTTAPRPENEAPARYFMVPVHYSDDFMGREDVMDHLNRLLDNQNKHCRAALVGLGGIGKTRIALEYAYRLESSELLSVFWIHASSNARLEKACLEIAKLAKISGWNNPTREKPDLVKAWLESTQPGKWLLILDNVDDTELLYGSGVLASFLPRSSQGAILLTTRNAKVGMTFAARNSIQIGALSKQESIALIDARLPEGSSTEEEREKLSEELACIPLALVQSSSFIAQNFLSIPEYLDIYMASDEEKVHLLSMDFDDEVRDVENRNPVATTWFITFEHLREHASMATELLSIMSMMDAQAIPESLLPFKSKMVLFKQALGTLQAFSLITGRNDGARWDNCIDKSYNMHRLVRLAMRSWLGLSRQFDKWTIKAVEILATEFPVVKWESKDRWTTYMPHATVVLDSAKLKVKDDDVPAVFLEQVAECGRHSNAEHFCPRCTAKVLHDMSACHIILGHHHLALEKAERAFILRRKYLGDDHLDTLKTLDSVAYSAKVLNHFQRAAWACERAIEGKRQLLGPENPMTLTSMAMLAIILRPMGKPAEAREINLQVLKTRRRVLGDLHEDTLKSMTPLSSSMRALGEYDAAEKVGLEDVEGKKQVLGDRHPDTLEAMACLAWIYACQGRYEEAEKLNLRALSEQIEIQGADHNNTMWTSHSMAVILGMQGRYSEALSISEELVILRERNLGPQHPFTYATRLYISWLYNELGRANEAVPICLDIVKFQISFFLDVSHPEVLLTKSQLASSYTFQGRHDLAEPIKTEVLAMRKANWPKDHPTTLRCISSLGMTRAEIGRLQDGEELLVEAWAKQKTALGEKHPETLTSMARLGSVYLKQGNVDLANTTIGKCLEMSILVLGHGHPRTRQRALILEQIRGLL
ncbi:hypothetical protein BP6252_14138 [Coleophoma cylindrospora]|uniref:NB-ARC domain-containing protein n=1 Tax=Coleophoma cylindrospora TaxID=1849047 RepID=A0A3D8Q3J6_9HELO|nr:hypothetical protein BP6252_14138 [Coleophoma cylindrospora]